jgi:hypothetical protein
LVQSQPRQIVHETLSRKYLIHKKYRVGGVAQGVDPEFKPQNHRKKKNEQTYISSITSLLSYSLFYVN